MMSNRIFGQSASVKEGNGWFGSLPSCSSSDSSGSSLSTLLYTCVCVRFLDGAFPAFFAFFRWFITPSLQRVTPAFSARWNAVPRWTSPCRVVSALENIRSACSRSYLADTRHNRWKNSRPASPQSVAMANASCTYSAYVGAISAPAVSTASQRRHNDSISSIILIYSF